MKPFGFASFLRSTFWSMLISLWVLSVNGAWSTPEKIPDSKIGSVDMAIQRDNSLCLIWTTGISGSSFSRINCRFYQQGTWQETTTVYSDDDCIFLNVQVCPGIDGKYHAVWFSNSSHFYHSIFYPETGWTEPDVKGLMGSYGTLVNDPDGNLYLFYVYQPDNFSHLYLKRFDGTWWTPEISLLHDIGVVDLSAVSDCFDGVHLACCSDTKMYVLHVNSDGNFSIHSFDEYICAPAIATDRMNSIHLVFTKIPNDLHAYYTPFCGQSTDLNQAEQLGTCPAENYLSDYCSCFLSDSFWGLYAPATRRYSHSPDTTNTLVHRISPFHSDCSDVFDLGPIDMPANMEIESNGTVHLLTWRHNDPDSWELYHWIRSRERPYAGILLYPQLYHPGDDFDLKLELSNPGTGTVHADLMLCLGVGDTYFWYPGWSTDVTSIPVSLDPDSSKTMEVLSFTVPELASSSGPLFLYTGMIDSGSGELIGDPSGVQFILTP